MTNLETLILILFILATGGLIWARIDLRKRRKQNASRQTPNNN